MRRLFVVGRPWTNLVETLPEFAVQPLDRFLLLAHEITERFEGELLMRVANLEVV